MIPKALERALRREPRTSGYLMVRGIYPAALPPSVERASKWTDHGWQLVYFIRPQRVSKRWARILDELKEAPCTAS